MKELIQYKNGNSLVTLYNNGTRIIETKDDFINLETCLNIDIKVTSKCSNGYNTKTGKAICSYCHESALLEGKECNYDILKDKLNSLNPGIELAIGGNDITSNLVDFIKWCNSKGFIVNLTVNQIHLPSYSSILKYLINNNFIKGLGISYRKDYQTKIDSFFIDYTNSVLHCIAGINTVDEVLNTPFNKVLILGYKFFGFGESYYSPKIEQSIRHWQMYLPKLFGKKIVSFDNLALQQLKVKRFFNSENWELFNQGEESFYINAVDGYYAPSSRTNIGKLSWDTISIQNYFKFSKKLSL